MAYKYSFRQSPNYTPGAQTKSVWGRNRSIDKIAIHWWGDPKTKPTFEGVINVLCNPSRQASSHYVAEAGRVCQLVKEADNSWATNSANPYTISIECNPRMSAGDLDTVGELIANIWKRLGKKGLIGHKDIVATACPGTYYSQFAKLTSIANKYLNPPPPPPKPVPPPPPTAEWVKNKKDYAAPVILYAKKGCQLYNIEQGKPDPQVPEFPEGKVFDSIIRETSSKGTRYYISKYSADKNIWKGFRDQDVTTTPPLPPEPKKNDPTPDSVAGVNRIGQIELRLSAIEKIVAWIKSFLEK